MSTAKIEAALLLLGDYAATAPTQRVATGTLDAVKEAQAELEAIRTAARAIDEGWENHGGREAAELIAAIAQEGT